jgi:hypothetical protein
LVGEIPADFMLHVLQFVLVDFQRFPKPVGGSMQHDCNMQAFPLAENCTAGGRRTELIIKVDGLAGEDGPRRLTQIPSKSILKLNAMHQWHEARGIPALNATGRRE